jgi:hypothetical protein
MNVVKAASISRSLLTFKISQRPGKQISAGAALAELGTSFGV